MSTDTLEFVGFSPKSDLLGELLSQWKLLEERMPVYSTCKAWLQQDAVGAFRGVCDLAFPGGTVKLRAKGTRPAKVWRYLMVQLNRYLDLWAETRSWEKVCEQMKQQSPELMLDDELPDFESDFLNPKRAGQSPPEPETFDGTYWKAHD